MFIQTEATPNPATLKFLPGQAVMETGTANFPTLEDAGRSPLACRLYEIEGVAGVFFGADFITVAKTDNQDWASLKPPILGVIMKHFTAGAPLFTDGGAVSAHAPSDEDDELVAQIKELLDTRVVRPWPKTAATFCFMGLSAASSTCTCRAPVRVAPVQRRR